MVTIGIMVYVSMSSCYNNLTKAQEDFYQEANFADYYFLVVKAPHQVVKEVENIKGVKRATGRITLDLAILKEDNKRATARIVTYSLPMDNELNRLLLEEGRIFTERGTGSGIEIMTNPGFKDANQIRWGDSIAVVYEGKPIYLTVVGTANSPEFVYPVKDITDIIPDHKNFGIFMIPQYEAGQVFNFEGQINQLLVEFTSDADSDQVVEEIKELLKPYGLLTSYPRDDQLSHAMLQAEFDSIRSLITTLPVIFLLIAAGIQFVILRRMVRHQRGQVGVLKALGYSNRHIILHYSSYALLVGFLGALLGSLAGWMLSGLLTDYFLLYFNMPSSGSGFNLQAIINGFLLSMGVGGVAGWSAARQVTKIQPAESMRREAPKMGRKSIVEEWPYLWRKLGTDW
ncbi:MAG: ABC transporter permease, partial [Syntrophomonadaceae bacterium]|nr:ABC transporter permease [Syntrophomonadaceae bacterium]